MKVMDDNSDAMIHLSYMYKNGVGTDPDKALAKQLLEKSAKEKNATALYLLKKEGIFNEEVLFDNLDN